MYYFCAQRGVRLILLYLILYLDLSPLKKLKHIKRERHENQVSESAAGCIYADRDSF